MNEKLFDTSMWVLYLANFCWIIAYDSFYAMSDYDDDKKLGVNSSITYWEQKSQNYIILFQSLSLVSLIILCYLNDLNFVWYLTIFFAALLFYYQHLISRNNEHLKAFKNNNYVIVGVSTDSPKSHVKFIEKNSLPFDLIADEDKSVHKLFGTWVEKKMYGKTYMGTARKTFLIDENRIITDIIEKVKTKEHTNQILGE